MTATTLKGKTALITGASSGIGRAIAIALAQEGCRAVLSGRNRERLSEVAHGHFHSQAVRLVGGDLTDETVIGQLANADPPDILVHCAAGIFHAPIAEIKPGDLVELLEQNVVVASELLRQIGTRMERGSSIVLLNSSSGINATAENGAYAASKFALRALADAFRAEINPRGVRVTSIFCGKTATLMQRRIYEERGEADWYDRIAREILQPEHVAQAVVGVLKMPANAEITDLHLRPTQKL